MKTKKEEIYDTLFRLFIVIVTNIFISIATVWFLEPAHLYSGGATGLAQLIQRLFGLGNININLGILIFVINVPIIGIGIKFVSKKFALYSIIAVVIQSLCTGLISSSPFEELSKEIAVWSGDKIVHSMNYGGILTLAIFAGLASGVATGAALRFGTSTGGIDVVAQSLALHKDFSIGNFTLMFNVLIALIGGGIIQGSWIIFIYTCVRMILNSLVTDKIHTSYSYEAVQIISTKTEEICDIIKNNFFRGCTLMNVEGGYSHAKINEVYCVVSKYEVDKLLKVITELDPKAFVTISPIRSVKGNFIRKSIV